MDTEALMAERIRLYREMDEAGQDYDRVDALEVEVDKIERELGLIKPDGSRSPDFLVGMKVF